MRLIYLLVFALVQIFICNQLLANEGSGIPSVSPAVSDPGETSSAEKRESGEEPSRKGQFVERMSPQPISPRPRADQVDSEAMNLAGTQADRGGYGWRFYITGFYSSASEVESEGTGSIGTTPFTFSGKDKGEGVFGYSLGVANRSSYNWGFEIGAGGEFVRTLNSYSGQVLGIQVSGDYADPKPEFNVGFILVNGRYYFNDHFSLHFGLNFSVIDLKNSDINLDGGFGAQFGLMGHLNQNLGLFIEYRNYMASGEESGIVDGDLYFGNYEEFILSGALAGIRVQF